MTEGYHRPLFRQTANTWESLRASEGLLLRPVDKAISHRQIYPTVVRESDKFNEIRRTAHIKHPLRARCATPDKYTTYEHDFRPIAIFPRVPKISVPKERPEVPKISVPKERPEIPKPSPPQDQDDDCPLRPDELPPRPASSASVAPPGSARSARSVPSQRPRSVGSMGRHSARGEQRHPARRMGTPDPQQISGLRDTLSMLNELSRATKSKLSFTTAGWGDGEFHKQLLGHSDRQICLIQTIHGMKLRSPDMTNLKCRLDQM